MLQSVTFHPGTPLRTSRIARFGRDALVRKPENLPIREACRLDVLWYGGSRSRIRCDLRSRLPAGVV